MIILFVMVSSRTISQTVQARFNETNLKVTFNKTTNIVFPSPISSVDRGSQDVLVQKASGADNVLRVKANLKNFPETNLTVITSDGRLYSFVVNYTDEPVELNVTVGNENAIPNVSSDASSKMFKDAALAKKKRSNIHSVSDQSSKVSLELKGFYVKNEVIFCKVKLENRSQINYDVEQFNFYIRDKKKSKRTASQEIYLSPISVTGDTGTLESKKDRIVIVAVPKFTIPDGKVMIVEMLERNGGRHLYLQAKNRHLMKARKL